jgi:RNA-directed DNA polymerase
MVAGSRTANVARKGGGPSGRREDILIHAYLLAKSKEGAPGVDGESFEAIESRGPAGLMEWLNGLGKELHDKTYKPQPVRRVMIPKPGGGERALGIPTIRDRVAQTAVKLIVEPIFEADLEPNAFGYRPNRSAQARARCMALSAVCWIKG